MPAFKTLIVLLLALLAMLAIACSDDDDDGDNGATDAPTATEEVATATDDASGGGEKVTVVMEGTAFDPTEITVTAGEPAVIAVENLDSFAHTLTVYNDEEFTDPQGAAVDLGGNESGEIGETFEAGTYFFRCEIHKSMQGTLTAE